MAVDMFLKLDGVPGESVDSTYRDQLDVLAWSWGLSSTGTGSAASGGRTSAAPDLQDLSVTLYQSIASVPLTLAVASGRRFPTAVLTVRPAGGRDPRWVMTMTDVVLSSLSTGGSGGEDRLTENVSLSFSKVEVAYTRQSSTGAGTTVAGTIDLSGGKVVVTG